MTEPRSFYLGAALMGLLLTAAPAHAQDAGPLAEEPQPIPDHAAATDGDARDPGPPMAAVLRGLDKVTARVREYTIPVGSTLNLGSLAVTIHKCHSRPPTETPESTAFVDVVERRANGDTETLFSGWMFASSPALNPLEHPVYDVWVMNCRILEPEQGDSSR